MAKTKRVEVRAHGSREDIVRGLEEGSLEYVDSKEALWQKGMDSMSVADRKSFMQGVHTGVAILMTDIWNGKVRIKSNFT